jgi:hypothetical protein
VGNIEQVVAELRGFRARKEVLTAMRRGIRTGVAPVRAAIRAEALATLPKRGGLNKWVAKTRINLNIRVGGTTARVRVIGGRRSKGGETDVNAIDRGRVRAPSWGRRGAGDWHTQTVDPGFFTETMDAADGFRADVDREVDRALDTIRRG